jgi:glycine cleavage system regulatory protein
MTSIAPATLKHRLDELDELYTVVMLISSERATKDDVEQTIPVVSKCHRVEAPTTKLP